MDRDEGGSEPLSASAEAVLAAVRRSVDVVQEFLETSQRQAAVIKSLENELGAARGHIATLEGETARLRNELTSTHKSDEIEQLIEEQNVLAHMFVCSDRLAAARTPREAIDIGIEVLHNLAGVHRYAVWLRAPGGVLRLVAPHEARWRDFDPNGALVNRSLMTNAIARSGGGDGVPASMPLLLDGLAVGVIEIRELVPQVPSLGRLQIDLLQFLSDRLAPAMCRAAISQNQSLQDVWATLAAAVPAIETRDMKEERRP
jgi:hypothetical protein